MSNATSETIYIGIDPSLTHTGLVALGDNGYLYSMPVTSKPVHNWCDQVLRERSVISQIENFISTYRRRIDVNDIHILVEDYAPGRFMKTVIPTVELGGQLRALLYDFSLSVVPCITVDFASPATLKQFATGKGNSDKIAVGVALATKYGVNFGSDDNLYDALNAAKFAQALDGRLEGLNKKQIALVEKAKYPKGKA